MCVKSGQQLPPCQYINKHQNSNRILTMQQVPKRRDQSIKTYVRIKPIPTSEESFVTSVNNNSIVIRSQEEYTYDRVFDGQATNQDIFQHIGQPLIDHCIEGYNSCVLAYGQTASGKTFTMKGNQISEGIIPLALNRFFSTIETKNLIAEIKISYIEIYNENIIDLLSSTEAYLEIREDYRKNISILGLTETPVSTVVEAMKLFNEGESRRKFASTNLNMISSRSHAIFRMNIEIVHEDYEKTSSLINMVDLAGSEGVSRTKAEGSTRKEGENINKSILALSNVIRCMSEKQTYINFRDSKLTRILQNSLCNNSRSVVICTINPTVLNYQETLNTLKFGRYASEVKLQLKKNISQTGQKTQQYPESQRKSGRHGDSLQPQQRIEYQQNKRIIATLRQDNQELRDYKIILNQKIQFLELENHRLLKQVQKLQEKCNQKPIETNFGFGFGEKEEYESQIRSLNQQMEIMADKYEALNEYSAKVEKNQRHLIERIAKYENQISLLKEAAQAKEPEPVKDKAKTPVKPKKVRPITSQNEQICPLTIGSMIVLKAQIIELKQSIYSLNQDVAQLVEQRNQLLAEVEALKDCQLKQIIESQESQMTDIQKKQNRNLHIRIKKLQNELQLGKTREKKLAKMLRSCSSSWLQQFNQFNQWYASRKTKMDSIKRLRVSDRKSSYKQKQNQPTQD